MQSSRSSLGLASKLVFDLFDDGAHFRRELVYIGNCRELALMLIVLRTSQPKDYFVITSARAARPLILMPRPVMRRATRVAPDISDPSRAIASVTVDIGTRDLSRFYVNAWRCRRYSVLITFHIFPLPLCGVVLTNQPCELQSYALV